MNSDNLITNRINISSGCAGVVAFLEISRDRTLAHLTKQNSFERMFLICTWKHIEASFGGNFPGARQGSPLSSLHLAINFSCFIS